MRLHYRLLTVCLAVIAIRTGAGAASAQAATGGPVGARRFDVVEATIPEMQRAMEEGRVTSREIVAAYLERIGLYESLLNAAITVNHRALAEAEERDRERAAGVVRGPLHGIPIALKDNIQTMDLPTTGGALAFRNFQPPYEATLVRNLREAGAIIIAKTGMTELANWVATAMPGNYNALTGFAMNPYDPRPDPRPAFADGRPVMPTGGSSSGVGTAANLWAASVGTETDGSILAPANQTMLVGIKPTVGRISRHGVIPLTLDQDTPGPMARTVTDAAILLGVLEGPQPDPEDMATMRCERPPSGSYASYLDPDGLRGARIGIPRAYFYDPITVPGSPIPRGGRTPEVLAAMEEVIAILRDAGAIVIDPVEVPSVVTSDPNEHFALWPICSGPTGARDADEGCSIVLKYGMKRDFNRWLERLGSAAPVPDLTALREWNAANERAGAIRYGQTQLDISDEVDLEGDRARYEHDRAKDLRLAAENGIDAVMAAHDLDALLFPGAAGASLAARAGYPTIIVPFGFIPNTTPGLPEGFAPNPVPFGVSFTAGACAEPRLIEIAYAFEQLTRRRVPPAPVP